MAKESKAFGSQRAHKAHLLRGSGGLQSEIQDLRNDVEEGFQNFEERAGFPELHYSEPPLAAGGDVILTGVDLLQGQTFDSLQLTESSGGGDLTLHALKPGDSGITVVVTVGAGALSVAYNSSTKVLAIELAAAGSSDDAVATAINADGADTDGHIRAVSAAGGDFTAAQASQAMTGGVGDYDGNKVLVGGTECLPANETGTTSTAKWTATTVKVTVPALAAPADKVFQISMMSDGTQADVLAMMELSDVASLQSDVSTAQGDITTAQGDITTLEGRADALEQRSGLPEVTWIDGGAPAAAGGDMVLKGTDLLQSQTFDSVNITEGAADLLVEMLKPGDSGFTVEVVAGAGALDIDLTGTKLTITLAAGGSTVNAIATAINANAADTDGYIRANEDASGSLTLDVAEQDFTGGTGTYAGNVVSVSGQECLPANETGATTTAKWSDTGITVTVPDLTALGDARAAGDIAAVSVSSDQMVSRALAVALA